MRLFSLHIIGFLVFGGILVCESYNPCCSLPCMNSGVCVLVDQNYECDCTATGYYGKNCETVRTKFVQEPSPYVGMSEYPTWNNYINKSVYARSLPPIPRHCPTPMGIKGPTVLPDIEVLSKLIFQRNNFEPCPMRTNVFFAFFAQHFTHQFFKTDPKKGIPFQWGDHSVDLSHIYGDTLAREHSLRMHIDGKMKYSIQNGEMFPPLTSEANVTMSGERLMKGRKFAIGHPGFAAIPTFFVISTLWLREHNRVCDIMKELHSDWDDERIFQTARLILTGETLKIIVEDYVQHVSGFHFQLKYEPEVLHGSDFSYHNQIHSEFQLLYHWHTLLPDFLKLGDSIYTLKELLFNVEPVVNAGMETVLKQLSEQFAGKVVGGRNQGPELIAVAELSIKQARELRMYPFNKYRERFGLKPYKTFEELTGEQKLASVLRDLYHDIDALEMYVGFFVEHRRYRQVLGETILEIGAPFSLKGVFGNPIGSPAWWKPSTFGGEVGFNIIKTTNLKKFICRNVKGCPDISFKVPENVKYKSVEKDVEKSAGVADILISLAHPEMKQTKRHSTSPSEKQKDIVSTKPKLGDKSEL